MARAYIPLKINLQPFVMPPRLKDVAVLKSFLGLIMFYSQSMPHHFTVLAPLHSQLKKNTPWKWSKVEEDAFVSAKEKTLTQKLQCIMMILFPFYCQVILRQNCWTSSVSSDRWTILACCPCLLYLTQGRGIQHYFRVKAISSVLVWSPLLNCSKSSSSAALLWTTTASSCSCSSSTSKMGTHSGIMQLQN